MDREDFNWEHIYTVVVYKDKTRGVQMEIHDSDPCRHKETSKVRYHFTIDAVEGSWPSMSSMIAALEEHNNKENKDVHSSTNSSGEGLDQGC